MSGRQELSPKLVKILKNYLSPDDNEEQICRRLIQAFFRLPANYSRPDPVFDPDHLPEQDQENLHYSRYSIGEFDQPYSDRVFAFKLTDSDIYPEDVQMFKNKLLILLTPWSKQMISGYYSQKKKLDHVKSKLTEWQSLLKPHNYG